MRALAGSLACLVFASACTDPPIFEPRLAALIVDAAEADGGLSLVPYGTGSVNVEVAVCVPGATSVSVEVRDLASIADGGGTPRTVGTLVRRAPMPSPSGFSCAADDTLSARVAVPHRGGTDFEAEITAAGSVVRLPRVLHAHGPCTVTLVAPSASPACSSADAGMRIEALPDAVDVDPTSTLVLTAEVCGEMLADGEVTVRVTPAIPVLDTTPAVVGNRATATVLLPDDVSGAVVEFGCRGSTDSVIVRR
jgi:hypothetical protein